MNGLSHLARFTAPSESGSLPAEAIYLAKLALVDYVGCAVAGTREPVARLAALQCADAPGGAVVIGQGFRTRAQDAAFANATIGHALDLDDSNMVLGGHPSVTLWPAVLAVAQTRHCTGAQALEAYVIGFEVILAMSRTVNFGHYERGWHPTATLGTFGVAAAVARLLGLNAQQSAVAIGLAASMASGVKANFGTMAKPLQVGEASRRGVLCALLAADGCTASEGALEAKQGFLAVYHEAGQYRPEELARIGDGLEILRSGISFKKYACCGSTHAPIDAALALRSQHGFGADDIASVRVALNARRRPHVDRPVVNDELAAKFSVQFTVSAALADGQVGMRHFTPESIARADLQRLLSRVEMANLEGGADALAQGCELTVSTVQGQRFSIRMADAEGRSSAAYPSYMEEKFNDCTRGIYSEADAAQLMKSLLAFDTCADVDLVIDRLASPLEKATP